MHQGILNQHLPFDSVCGLSDAKTALLCMAVNPSIKGLLIRGPAGVGKTVLLRSLVGSIIEHEPVIVPLNTTDEQIFGSMDLEHAILTGETRFVEGRIAQAQGTFLSIDDVNLFDHKFIHVLMTCVLEGRVVLERDGVSMQFPCDTAVIASMNSREAPLNKSVSDLFDMCVSIVGSTDEAFREDVIRTNLNIPDEFPETDDKLIEKVSAARKVLPKVMFDDDMLEIIVEACIRFNVKGYRGELSAVKVAKTLAALDGRYRVNTDDVTKALQLCLEHRRERYMKISKEEKETINFYADSHMKRFIHDDRKTDEGESEEAGTADLEDAQTLSESLGDPESAVEIEDAILEVGEMFDSIDLIEDALKGREATDSKMKRRFIKDDGRDGRYVSSRPAEEGCDDLAFDATIRAAAPYQNLRHRNSDREGFIVESGDLREKVREKHTSCLFMFMIDNSGSLIVRGRMRNVKAAIMSMLQDHYVRKDSVAIMTFNDKQVGMLMQPSRSIGSIKKLLEDLPVGNKTPLSEALVYGNNYIKEYMRKHPGDRCFVVVMSDGLANVSMDPENDPFEEALHVASHIGGKGVEWIVVDTSPASKSIQNAKILAQSLYAPYYKLDELRSSNNV